MEAIINKLHLFSEKYDLWNLTQKHAVECIDNALNENRQDNYKHLTSENFILKKKKQELLFWHYDNQTFILRTTYDLYIDGQEDKNLVYGEYSLDVGIDGKIVDDWLVFY